MYNNDVAIIDFLADLADKEPIRGLQKFIDITNKQPVCLLYSCPFDNVYVVIMYKAPFDFNDGDNKLMLFVYDNLAGLYRYFERWGEQLTKYEQGAINDILRTISYELSKMYDIENTQADFLG